MIANYRARTPARLICINVGQTPRSNSGAMKRLLAMLRRRGAALPQNPDRDAVAAIARCEACTSTKLCDELLASPGNGGYRAFCPNAGYIEQRRERALKF